MFCSKISSKQFPCIIFELALFGFQRSALTLHVIKQLMRERLRAGNELLPQHRSQILHIFHTCIVNCDVIFLVKPVLNSMCAAGRTHGIKTVIYESSAEHLQSFFPLCILPLHTAHLHTAAHVENAAGMCGNVLRETDAIFFKEHHSPKYSALVLIFIPLCSLTSGTFWINTAVNN